MRTEFRHSIRAAVAHFANAQRQVGRFREVRRVRQELHGQAAPEETPETGMLQLSAVVIFLVFLKKPF